MTRKTEPVPTLFFMGVPMHGSGSGGSLCCRTHLLRLAKDPALSVTALLLGPEERRTGSPLACCAEIGVPAHFVALTPFAVQPEAQDLSSLWSFAMALTFQHSWEQRAINQGHVLRAVNHAIAMHGIKALMIDHHPSALYLKMPRNDVATILIGLNRKGNFHADMVRRGLTHHRGLAGAISVARARAFEERVNRAVDQLVVIGAPDAPPRSRLRAEARCITPWRDADGVFSWATTIIGRTGWRSIGS